MRSNIPASVLFTFSTFWAISSSLPLVEQRTQNTAPLAPRYSVVAINGGSGAGESSGSGSGPDDHGASHDAPVTVVKTVLSTLPPEATNAPATKSPPAKTKHGISTVNINQSPGTKTETSVIYVTPSSPPRTSTTSQSAEPTDSTSQPHTSQYHTSQHHTSQQHTSLSTSTRSPTPTSSSSTHSTSAASTYPPSTTSIILTTAYSSTKTYDNGMWHTTYPSWNATTARGARHA